jgi:ADP-heptose:LPS heptosyltransferase
MRTNLDYFMPYPDNGSEIERHLRLMEFLGIPSQGVELEFPLTRQDQHDYDDLKLHLRHKEYVCIHPGSRGSWRQWPARHFAAVADYAVACGFDAVLTGTKDESDIVNEVISYMKQPAINLRARPASVQLVSSLKMPMRLFLTVPGYRIWQRPLKRQAS